MPAIKANFMKFSAPYQFSVVSEEKRMVMGPALIPDLPIYRKNERGEFFVWFSRSTVRKSAELFLARQKTLSHTLEHAAPVSGVAVVESWIVENPAMDKAKHHGFDVKAGTWMITSKVHNTQLWEDYVKPGKVLGFSIEGLYGERVKKPAAV
jgi:hypothetical protein